MAQAQAYIRHHFPQGAQGAWHQGTQDRGIIYEMRLGGVDWQQQLREPASTQLPAGKALFLTQSRLLTLVTRGGGLLAQHHPGLGGQIGSILSGHLLSHHLIIPP